MKRYFFYSLTGCGIITVQYPANATTLGYNQEGKVYEKLLSSSAVSDLPTIKIGDRLSETEIISAIRTNFISAAVVLENFDESITLVQKGGNVAIVEDFTGSYNEGTGYIDVTWTSVVEDSLSINAYTVQYKEALDTEYTDSSPYLNPLGPGNFYNQVLSLPAGIYTVRLVANYDDGSHEIIAGPTGTIVIP